MCSFLFFLKKVCKIEKKLLTTCFDVCYSKISIESVRGTAPMTTQQPAKWQGAKG